MRSFRTTVFVFRLQADPWGVMMLTFWLCRVVVLLVVVGVLSVVVTGNDCSILGAVLDLLVPCFLWILPLDVCFPFLELYFCLRRVGCRCLGFYC